MAAPLGPDNREAAKREFLLSFRKLGTIGAAAEQVGVNRSTVYGWLNSDDEFVADFDNARESLTDALESSVYFRAFKDPILAMFYLKARRAEFKDKLQVDVESINAEIGERMRRLGIDPQKLFSSLGPGDAPELKLLEAPKQTYANSRAGDGVGESRATIPPAELNKMVDSGTGTDRKPNEGDTAESCIDSDRGE